MGIYFYWGEDSFAIAQAVKALKQQTLDPMWESFNFDKFSPEQSDAVVQALNQAMTPPFGTGNRLVWLSETTLAQRCPEEMLSELDRTLTALPDTTTLLLTSSSKPDGRLKSTKLLQTHATIQEFSLIPPWKTELIRTQVQRVAQEFDLKLTSKAIDYITEAVGNDTRQLYSELEKLKVFAADSKKPLDESAIAPLITASTQSSLQLLAAIRQGKTAQALELVADLLRQNEPALRIVSTLVGQFRLRLWIKLMLESGERDDREIAKAAELGNPKQLYFLKQELQSASLQQLQQVLPILLELEFSLKRGSDETITLQTKVIELCQIFQFRK
ncbi:MULTISPECIES: DNA polymerase III subunit delta [Leptolyngbya]|jgi:DNA polymerase-3 subunit delta|uniref:DNA polymerase III subunit delta n=2 Tax=Leptolyngbya boryana TaxID=1184 RepID=A0A1Z4JDP8_LEPBY|nr:MULTISPECIES: DNA polymerase III subunit delta [Leptolyngbya]BAY54861.1 DNA polymerase III subunit delta [Leptolyngbya boryana NIES-2135]MBD2365842.1 DNA polymerase III subunit delta [Leptolyngbya sp. FACHB-161]MBD2372022.1 DNA polymerase III subunit delta [Leptolyngbya sp. FACHB-238]MBD2396446.1 DNA polymerase III subunit delta [Leptolyngbya sp. FACHB-239]MBD2402968.1 DNA polymerase III subunit delta [Leptolyngbya sp. FACHB-402]